MSTQHTWREGATTGETLGPAMKIETQEEADAYFAALLEWSMRQQDVREKQPPREEIEAVLRSNLGYYAGYYSNETRERVERLFRCAHPIFGAIAEAGAPTLEEAFEMGRRMGEAARAESAGKDI